MGVGIIIYLFILFNESINDKYEQEKLKFFILPVDLRSQKTCLLGLCTDKLCVYLYIYIIYVSLCVSHTRVITNNYTGQNPKICVQGTKHIGTYRQKYSSVLSQSD